MGEKGGFSQLDGGGRGESEEKQALPPPAASPETAGTAGTITEGGRRWGRGVWSGDGGGVVRDKRCKKRARKKAVVAAGVGPSQTGEGVC